MMLFTFGDVVHEVVVLVDIVDKGRCNVKKELYYGVHRPFVLQTKQPFRQLLCFKTS
jgi:hypothetical protein